MRLISIDGLHQSDLARCEANNQCPNLASLKVMEHGGFAPDDTHVAMLVVNGANMVAGGNSGGTTVTTPVRTYQVAPTILADLGLNPHKLDSVRIEYVQVLPAG